MKYKVGDRVRIISNRTQNMNPNGAMNKYLGRVMTIKKYLLTTIKLWRIKLIGFGTIA